MRYADAAGNCWYAVADDVPGGMCTRAPYVVTAGAGESTAALSFFPSTKG